MYVYCAGKYCVDMPLPLQDLVIMGLSNITYLSFDYNISAKACVGCHVLLLHNDNSSIMT